MKTGARILLGLPFYQQYIGQTIDSQDNGVDPRGQNQYVKYFCGDSFLARCFNKLWVTALNERGARRLTHFAMHHSDVLPQPYYLDILVGELNRCRADLVSAVLPIKTEHGLTSTALRNRNDGEIRRLTMKEVYKIPCKTFDGPMAANALGWADAESWDILPSTGLWICSFTDNWVEKVWFEVRDRILKKDNGDFYVETAPDDWLFATKLHRLGVRLMSTKAVAAGHWGIIEFRNDKPWGTEETDPKPGTFSWLKDEGL